MKYGFAKTLYCEQQYRQRKASKGPQFSGEGYPLLGSLLLLTSTAPVYPLVAMAGRRFALLDGGTPLLRNQTEHFLETLSKFPNRQPVVSLTLLNRATVMTLSRNTKYSYVELAGSE